MHFKSNFMAYSLDYTQFARSLKTCPSALALKVWIYKKSYADTRMLKDLENAFGYVYIAAFSFQF